MLASSRELAETTIRRAQKRYKGQFDRRAQQRPYNVGDWVMVKFPQKEQGRMRKLSHPWHGPYRVIERNDPDLTVSKVYYFIICRKAIYKYTKRESVSAHQNYLWNTFGMDL